MYIYIYIYICMYAGEETTSLRHHVRAVVRDAAGALHTAKGGAVETGRSELYDVIC